MENKATIPAATGRSIIQIQQFNFTALYREIKASIVSVLMWLSVIGGSL